MEKAIWLMIIHTAKHKSVFLSKSVDNREVGPPSRILWSNFNTTTLIQKERMEVVHNFKVKAVDRKGRYKLKFHKKI